MNLDTIYSQIGWTITVLVMMFVLLKGDEPERIGGAAFVLTALAATMIPKSGLGDPRWGVMGLDAILLAVFLGLAWHSRRSWPVWAAAFQGLVVAGHVLVAANLRPPHNAVAAVINMSNYGLLIAMAIGTFWAWQERKAAHLSERPGASL